LSIYNFSFDFFFFDEDFISDSIIIFPFISPNLFFFLDLKCFFFFKVDLSLVLAVFFNYYISTFIDFSFDVMHFFISYTNAIKSPFLESHRFFVGFIRVSSI